MIAGSKQRYEFVLPTDAYSTGSLLFNLGFSRISSGERQWAGHESLPFTEYCAGYSVQIPDAQTAAVTATSLQPPRCSRWTGSAEALATQGGSSSRFLIQGQGCRTICWVLADIHVAV